MNNKRTLRATPQLVLGLLVVLVGVLFTLDNLGFLYAGDYIQFWPAGLMAIGALKLWQSGDVPGRLAGILFLGVGSVLLFGNLLDWRVHFWDFWPVVLVFVGGVLVWHSLRRRAETAEQAHATSSNQIVNAIAVLGGVTRTIATDDFQGGELTAILGGCEIDLSRASMRSQEAVLQVFAMWGGMDIRVPEDWTVVLEGLPLMAGIVDKTRPPQGGVEKRLVVKGIVVMGGVEIKN